MKNRSLGIRPSSSVLQQTNLVSQPHRQNLDWSFLSAAMRNTRNFECAGSKVEVLARVGASSGKLVRWKASATSVLATNSQVSYIATFLVPNNPF